MNSEHHLVEVGAVTTCNRNPIFEVLIIFTTTVTQDSLQHLWLNL